MEKRIAILTIVGSVLLAVVLVGTGTLIGHSLYEPKTIVLNTNGEQSNSIKFTQAENTITVVGQSNLNVKPEVALISLGIEICDPDAQKANSQINDRLTSVTAGLQEIGLDKTEVVPSNFSLYPRYDYSSGNTLTGFCATNQIRVTTTKLNQVSSILDKAIGSGATNVYGVNFTAKDVKVASQEGIQLAFQDAENQAQALAKLMNMSVQGIVSSNIDMSGNLLDTFVGYSGGGGSVNPQEGTMTIKVTVVYQVVK